MPVRAKRGKLFFDFFWKGVRCKEHTGLSDTPENRQRCGQKMQVVNRTIARGTSSSRQDPLLPRSLFCLVPSWMALLGNRGDSLRLAKLRPPDNCAPTRAYSTV